MKEAQPDLAKNTLGVLSIVVMIVASLWTLRPFLGATIWAAMLVVATWPRAAVDAGAAVESSRSGCDGDGGGAAAALRVPLTMAISTIATHADVVVDWIRSLASSGLPQLPDWIGGLPLVGPKVTEIWNELLASGVAGLQAKVTPYARDVTTWLLTQAGVVGTLTLQFLLTVVIAGVMYGHGETAARKIGCSAASSAARVEKMRSCSRVKPFVAWHLVSA